MSCRRKCTTSEWSPSDDQLRERISANGAAVFKSRVCYDGRQKVALPTGVGIWAHCTVYEENTRSSTALPWTLHNNMSAGLQAHIEMIDISPGRSTPLHDRQNRAGEPNKKSESHSSIEQCQSSLVDRSER